MLNQLVVCAPLHFIFLPRALGGQSRATGLKFNASQGGFRTNNTKERQDLEYEKVVKLSFPRRHGCRWYDLGILVLSDTAWATKSDGNRQRSYSTDRATMYAMLDWKSFTLKLECRNSSRNNSCRRGGVCEHILGSDPRPPRRSVGGLIHAKFLYDSVKESARTVRANPLTHWNRCPMGIFRTTVSRRVREGQPTTAACKKAATADTPSVV